MLFPSANQQPAVGRVWNIFETEKVDPFCSVAGRLRRFSLYGVLLILRISIDIDIGIDDGYMRYFVF